MLPGRRQMQDGVIHQYRELVYNDESAIAFANVPDNESVVLLTPAISLAMNGASTANTVDPFEVLGRAMSQIHPNIMHVPYVPHVGLTSIHAGWMSRFAAVLIVVCEPIAGSAQGQDESRTNQLLFAQAAVDGYHRIHEGTEPPSIALAYCGTRSFTPPRGISLCVQGPGYHDANWAALANAVLGAFHAEPQ